MRKWDYKNMKTKDLPKGGLIPEAGTAEDYQTGNWRSRRPELDLEKCINCLFCFMWCPDSSVIVENGKVVGFDLKHCKGCGICAEECPKHAIEMKNE